MPQRKSTQTITINQRVISAVMTIMGRKGGRIGGKRRLVTLTRERRQEIGRLAAQKRWGAKRVAKRAEASLTLTIV